MKPVTKQTTRNRKPGQTIKPMDEYVLGTSTRMAIRAGDLRPHPRESGINASHVKRIASTYDPDALGVLYVWKKEGKKGDEFYVLDGNHRLAAILSLFGKDYVIDCKVVEGDEARAAQLIVDYNRKRISYNPLDTFAQELKYGNPAAVEVKRCVEARGLKISAAQNGATVAAVSALQNVYASTGYVGLSRTLDTILAAWPDEERRFDGKILLGVHSFYSDKPNADVERVAAKLAHITPLSLMRKATQRWYSWRGLGNEGKSVIECVGEEIAREYRKHSKELAAA